MEQMLQMQLATALPQNDLCDDCCDTQVQRYMCDSDA